MSESPRFRGEEEAARWFARRRRGIMTLEERAAYEQWRRDPGRAATMAEFDRVWALLGQAWPSAAPMRSRAPRRRANLTRSALLAVMCLVSLGLGFASYSDGSGFWTELDWVQR